MSGAFSTRRRRSGASRGGTETGAPRGWKQAREIGRDVHALALGEVDQDRVDASRRAAPRAASSASFSLARERAASRSEATSDRV